MDNNKITAETLAMEVIRQAKTQARMWFIAFILCLAALVGTNIYWIHEMNSYEYVYQDGEGQNNYNNNVSGEVHNVSNGKEEEER